ncbi:signal peptidase II [Clavibacter michiganensis]|uniref:signal peptidase II n=1 Tax=Clavibacter michiganensis TaxID=28447 RepID=UPI0013652119|nr:signal peptidase II [Clavibacter michiganensis]MBW8027719.1 signal peptidase II [Clavibacter michiganensis subsp. michiganensis]MDO4041982.1 signal peptidase II [Clavibacter michiganensis]MDO4060172.1 signal peptidase II [Clavibacter michiganensis]MDO4079273.1 signal peptidase II [Clavibacter michiganensis]MDO4094352.1 signal peptidase II [Clavibacter michiganensis]
MTTAPAAARRPRTSRPVVVALAVVVVVVGFVLDQLSKRWAVDALGGGETIPLFPTARFALVYNPGVSFGMGAEVGPLLTVGIMALALGLAVWVGWQIRHRASLLQVLLLSAVLAGALGNLFDRITRAEDGPLSGHVVDFIAVEWFAVFNVADILTVCGMIAWALTTVFGRDHVADAREADAVAEADDAAVDPASDTGSAATDRA